jgi:hypothetical protein
MRSNSKSIAVAMVAACLLFGARTQAEENFPGMQIDYLKIVKAYADTMMMALLKLWQVQKKPDLSINLIYTDR